jgi:hypothetical protein
VAAERNLSFKVSPEVFQYSDDVLEGRADPRAARRLDLTLTGDFVPGDLHYTIECKRLGRGATARDYVEEGIARFVAGAYGKDQAIAGMIGYVMSGSIQSWHTRINTQVSRHPSMGTSGQLGQLEYDSPEAAVSVSTHTRSLPQVPISLTHAFLNYIGLPNPANVEEPQPQSTASNSHDDPAADTDGDTDTP